MSEPFHIAVLTLTITHYDWGDWRYDEDGAELRWVEGVAAEAISDHGGDAQVWLIESGLPLAETHPELIAQYRDIAQDRVLARYREARQR